MSAYMPPRVDCRYGAPMGRVSGFLRTAPVKVLPTRITVRRVRLDAGGYDGGGAYWGAGTKLWMAMDDGAVWQKWFRSPDCDAAKIKAREMYASDLEWHAAGEPA